MKPPKERTTPARDPERDHERDRGRFGERWLRSLWPPPLAIDSRERLRVTLGAALGLLVTALLCGGFDG